MFPVPNRVAKLGVTHRWDRPEHFDERVAGLNGTENAIDIGLAPLNLSAANRKA
jgi:hypothetical protein